MNRRVVFLFLLFAPALLQATPLYTVRVVAKIPHNRTDYTQGLEIHKGVLYQSTGQYGASKLQTFTLADGTLINEHKLEDKLFGEGLTLLADTIYQLTWRSGRVLRYQRDNLEPAGELTIPGEGWGLANNGQELIYSDGSDKLHFLSRAGTHLRSISVRHSGRPVKYLNELEWTPDYLLANIWGSDWIVMINPDSGAVVGRIDAAGLLERRERRRGTDVLNGIARDPANGNIWLTGKNWPWLYQIELQEKK